MCHGITPFISLGNKKIIKRKTRQRPIITTYPIYFIKKMNLRPCIIATDNANFTLVLNGTYSHLKNYRNYLLHKQHKERLISYS